MRTRLALTAVAGLCVLGAAVGGASAPYDAGERGDAGERAWSVQLHLHGSYSEGEGSIGSHSVEATEVGVDAIWWSDHDWRIGSYRHCSTFSFDGPSEALDHREPWSARGGELPTGGRLEPVRKRLTPSRWSSFTAERALEGEACLRVDGGGQRDVHPSIGPSARAGGFEGYLVDLVAHRRRFRRPLGSDVTLRLAVWPEQLGPEARPVIELELSEHSGEDGGLETLYLTYYLTDSEAEPLREGARYSVPVVARPGEWNRLELRLTEDAVRGFGEVAGADNAMARISLGVEVRGEARCSALFDDLSIGQELSGAAALSRQLELIDAVAARHPGLTELQGMEVSYLDPHLNVFVDDMELPDYERLAAESGLVADDPAAFDDERFGHHVARAVVAAVHARGGLVSYNHLFGTDAARSKQQQLTAGVEATRAELLADLIETRLFGADLLEVGYRDRGGHDLDDYLWVWDQLAERGLYPVGTGVSDSHGGLEHRWRGGGNNFVSWIWAPSLERGDLIEGLRSGRVFFGDAELFQGSLDLATARGFHMGQVVLTDRDVARVTATVDGMPEGFRLRWAAGEETLPASSGGALHETLELAIGARAHVRIELLDRRGRPVVLSNPVHFLTELPAGGIPAPRVGFDVGGVRSLKLAGLTVLGVSAAGGGLEIRVAADGGRIELDASALGREPEVTFEGLDGERSGTTDALVLSELAGTGTVRVSPR